MSREDRDKLVGKRALPQVFCFSYYRSWVLPKHFLTSLDTSFSIFLLFCFYILVRCFFKTICILIYVNNQESIFIESKLVNIYTYSRHSPWHTKIYPIFLSSCYICISLLCQSVIIQRLKEICIFQPKKHNSLTEKANPFKVNQIAKEHPFSDYSQMPYLSGLNWLKFKSISLLPD